MHLHDIAVVALGLVSEFLGTLSGFGSSTFFVPLGVLFEKYNFILALTAVLHVFGNLSKLYLFRKQLDRKLLLELALPSIVLTAAGALLSRYIEIEKLKMFLGFFIIALSAVFFFKLRVINYLSMRNSKVVVAISGFLTGLLGTGGALRGIALTSLHLEKSSFVAISSGIDIGGDVLRGAVYFYNGYFDFTQWYYIPALLVVSYIGSRAGRFALQKINQAQFEKIVMLFVFCSGLALILQG